MTDLKLIYGHASHRPLALAIAKAAGLVTDEAGIADAQERVDPYELVRQRAQRDFGKSLLDRMGWRLDVVPPPAGPKDRQQAADSEPGGGEHAAS